MKQINRRQFIKSMFVGAAGLVAVPGLVASEMQATAIVASEGLTAEFMADSVPMLIPNVREAIVRSMMESLDMQMLNRG